ncbi:GAF domain-containing protein [Neobacillus dielmonensis]|uniref:GAF domain-containing protein n=1 Tax=Neobacillus dielmonensis TaxID=1347369 RepID=UPI0012B62B75|nr:GAF domain-containing protein [Neobacillus dielmonensis]
MIVISSLLDNSLNLLDYRLFYIVTASFLFGRSQSILSIGLASVWFFYQNILNGQEIISQLIDHTTLVHIGLYIFIGLSMGYVLEKKEKMVQNSRSEMESIQEKLETLTSLYKDTLFVKNELQDQVLYTNNSIATVYEVMKDLNSLDRSVIYSSSITILEKIMKTSGAALYLLDYSEKTLGLVEKSTALVVPASLEIRKQNTLLEAIEKNTVKINKDLDPNLPTLVAPISIKGQVIGVVGLYNPEFEYLTLSYQNLLFVTANLISSALTRAFEHEQLLTSDNSRKNKLFDNKEEAYV